MKPERNITESQAPAIPISTSPVQSFPIKEQKNEVLFNVDNEEPVEHANNSSARILDDLNDLQFEQKDGLITDENPSTGKRIILLFPVIIRKLF